MHAKATTKASKSANANRVMVIIALFILITMVLACMVYIEGQIFDGVRAYVRGEGLWAKAQKDAVLYLDRYSYTLSDDEYISFKQAIGVIDGDRQAKLALRESPPDLSKAKLGFLQGKNDLQDCNTMIEFFLNFNNISYMHEAINIWDKADNSIVALKKIGTALRHEAHAGQIDRANVQELRKRLWTLNNDLYDLENQFSHVLSKGARWIKRTIWQLCIAIFFIFTGTGILISRRIINAIIRSERELIISESRFRSLNEANIIGIAAMRMDGQVVEANDLLLNMLGYKRSELDSGCVNWQTITPESEADADSNVFQELTNNGWCKPHERKFAHRNGSLIPVYLGASMIKGDENLAIAFALDLTDRKQAEERFQKFFSLTPDLACIANTDGNFLKTNNRWQEVLGYTERELTSTPFIEFIHPDDIEATIQEAAKLKNGIATLRFGNRYRHKDGSYRWLEWSAMPYGDILYATARDVSEQKQLTERANQTQKFLQLQIDRMPIAHIVWDADFRIQAWNPAATRIFGFTKQEILGKQPYGRIIPKEAKRKTDEIWSRLLSGDSAAHFINDNITKDGHAIVCEWTNTPLNERNGEVTSVLSMVQDITERIKNEEVIRHQANFDELTNLPNRQMFQNRLQREAAKMANTGQSLAALLIDLDRFKEVNDTLGHEKGDQLLIEAAQRISSCARRTDTVARLGGDEFIVIAPTLDETEAVDRIAQNIINKLAAPFDLGVAKTYISASIGISHYPNDSPKLEDLLKNADQAMYAAKNAGRNRFSHFTFDMQEAALNRLHLTNELRNALEKKQFQLYYQPIVELSTGVIRKAEALIRWFHPERGLISPADFIPLCEETGLIVPLGEWVFKEALQHVAQWRNTYHKDFQVSVNKSPIQFQRRESESWADYLKRHNSTGQGICIEITEGLLLNAEEGISNKLLEFRDAGMQVAIDDFGTGYSSLSYLKKFDIDYLKIDQSFVRNLSADTSDIALCEAMIVMAHKLGFKVIAEGVEKGEQLDILMKFGCDFAQGYLFSKPLPPEEFEKMVKHNIEALKNQGKGTHHDYKTSAISDIR